MAMIIALGTSVNVFAQQRNLKIYFNQYVKGATGAPTMLVTDDNNSYDLPAGLTYSSEGVAWANSARFFEWISQDVTDRLVADYVIKNNQPDKKHSKLKLTFTDFPYEVNAIQWNAMNDLLSGSLTNFFKNYNVTTTCVPQSGNGFSYTEESWALNPFAHQTGFSQSDIPWKKNGNEYATLKGLKSFEISEYFEIKVGLFNWTILDLGEAELSDKVRTFIKAGWNGSKTNPKIILRDRRGNKTGEADVEGDDRYWAFKVKFTLPDIRMRSYKCTVDNNFNVTLGQIDNNIIVGERAKHALRGYIAAHAGAVVPIEAPTDPEDIDPNDFHYEYEADKNKINIHTYTGVIYEAKVAGDIPVTVKLMRGDRLVCSYPQTIHVYSNDPTRSEIAIGFLNGNKGYDVTVGDQNAQIQGIITKYGENITLSNGTSGYHFEYSEDSHGEIIDIDPLTGKITAKKEGDVVVSAVLKNGGTIRSNTYTYSLHVFAQHEGLDWKLEKTYTYTNSSSNKDEWKISTKTTNSLSNKWESKDLLMVNTTINGSSDWKQIACFTTPASQNWRGICQTIQFDLRIPKYTKVTGTYPLAGNLNIGSSKGPIKYGFESKDLGAVDAATADTNVKEITWKTQGYHNATNASTNKYSTQIIADATSYNNGNIGNEKDYRRSLDNLTSEHVTGTRYLAIMAYLHRDYSYPGDASFGFKNIPTYEYYSTVTYYKNDGTNDVWKGDDWNGTQTFNSPSKTATMPMYNGPLNLKRDGYELLGWSTDPNATTAEYKFKGDNFCPYDDVNGGGKGPVDLYAVWRAIPYIVTLNHNYSPYETEEIVAYYGQPMPEDESIVAPTRTGYDFTGYRTQKDITPQVFYYNAEMKSVCNYDKTSDYTIFANWEAHTTKITFDFQGGNGSTTEVTATYGEAMPTATAPSRTGYTFAGYYYYSEANGQGTKYYNADMTSVRTWNVDEPEVTLHAKWIPLTYTVTLDRQGGTGGSTSVTATYGQPMPAITVPTRPGYEFYGYFTAKDYNDNYLNGGTRYYNSDGTSAKNWDKNSDVTLYAHWKSAKYIVTFDINGGIKQEYTQYESDPSMSKLEEITDQLIKISFTYGHGGSDEIINAKPKLGGFKCVGFYDVDNVLVASVNTNPANYNITINKNNKYWKDGNWNWPHDVTFTARYEPKFTYENNVLDFGTETLEIGRDWSQGVIHDVVDAAEYLMTKERVSADNPVMVVNLNNAHYLRGDLDGEFLKVPLENKPYFSPNLLVYFKGYYNLQENQVQDGKCLDLVVTDRFPIKIPYAFDAQHASYARDANVASGDAAKDQAKNSTWGTLCLPYPIKNDNRNGVKFYELQSTANNYMEFEEMAQDEEIPANTPVLYIRADGGVSSMITIKEQNVGVPMNANYTAVNKSYSNADESIRDWEFRGNLKTTVFYGKGYVNPPAGAQILDGDVYYFKQDKFTYLNPKMEKNGKTYQAAKMTLYPYRAYFYRNTEGSYYSSAKVSEYSILVIGEDGATLDITNEIFGDGEGDGKIYDLNGIRVMKPVKGRLYIVNGQKKVYK